MYVEIFPSKAVVFPGKRQKWYVRLRSDNRETINISQGYVSKWNAKRAANRMFPNLNIHYPNSE